MEEASHTRESQKLDRSTERGDGAAEFSDGERVPKEEEFERRWD